MISRNRMRADIGGTKARLGLNRSRPGVPSPLMPPPPSDAIVLFGATGDLARKKLFPALQAMLKRGHLDVPVIGIARSALGVEAFRADIKKSLAKSGQLDRRRSPAWLRGSNTSQATIAIRRRGPDSGRRSGRPLGRCTISPSHPVCSQRLSRD